MQKERQGITVSAKPNKQMIVRAVVVMVSVILCLTVVSTGSLINIMIFKGEKYQALASEQQLYDSLVTAPRGEIYDKNMNLLATSATAWTVYITPNGINGMSDKEKAEKVRKTISEGLSPILGIDENDIYEKTKQKTYYVILKKKIEKDTADKIRKFISDNSKLELSSYIGLDETTKRYYPNDTLASAVLGFVGDDNQGLAGLESYYDNILTGVAGRVVAAKNAKGTNMPFTYEKVEEAKQGDSLVLTIDSYVQYAAEKYLDAAVEEFNAVERGAAIVMNVNTGEILGMAVSGDFNPNDPFTLSAEDQAQVDAAADEEAKKTLKAQLLNRQWRNKAVSDTYEPGSVFKIFTASTALEENLVNEKSTFTCNHTYVVSGTEYNCHENRGGHGTQNLVQALANSCNPAFIQIGQLIGVHSFSKYFKAFGLGERTGIDLPGEAYSNYYSEDKMGPVELASASFGQTFNITPMQMITLAAAVTNGGYLVQPHLVSKVVDSDGNVKKTVSTDAKRQVISKATSDKMRTYLEYVVQNGAKNGKVAGYRVGGKTGTSQKMALILSSGNRGLYIGSYVGIAPIENPEIAVFVMIDQPTGGAYYGSQVSAPAASKIMADILPYLGFEPQYSEEELKNLAVAVPDLSGKPIATAKSLLNSAGLDYKIVGNGGEVKRQLPEAGSSVYKGGTVIIYTDDTAEEETTVPQLTGLTAAQVNTAAAAASINIEFSGNASSSGAKSYKQSVPAGTKVKKGQIITVSFTEETQPDMAER